MSSGSTSAAAAAPHVAGAVSVARPSVATLVMQFLGSMKLSVWLLLILALLTWLGTLAQKDRSTHDVQREYFESWWVIAELPLSFWGKVLFETADGKPWPLRIPLPGAYPVMGLLFVNLLVGGFLRMKWSARNAGILITHFGIAFLLIAGFVKLHYSYAGMLSVYEWPANGNAHPDRVYQTARFESSYDDELVLLVDRGDTVEERLLPAHELRGARDDGRVVVTAAGLPFRIEVHHWVDWSQAMPKGPMVKTLMPVVEGVFLKPVEWPAGMQPRAEAEMPGCYVTILGDGGERIEGILQNRSLMPMNKARYPLAFTVKGQRYGLDLRRVIRDLPFELRLDKFQKKDHHGTMSPMDFRSFVSVVEGGAAQEAQVFMNNPLRKAGYVVYQSSWGPQIEGVPRGGPPWFSVFEVSHNPSDFWPALACFVIALGLLWHFLVKLRRFLQSSARASLQPSEGDA